MTVAAIVLGSGRGSAMADAEGRPACRRIADAAWARIAGLVLAAVLVGRSLLILRQAAGTTHQVG